jgi:hypothetical protein
MDRTVKNGDIRILDTSEASPDISSIKTKRETGSKGLSESRMFLPTTKDSRVGAVHSNAFLKWKDRSGTKRTIYFQTINESYSFSKAANYDSIDIPGRNEPIKTWTGSGEKKIPLTLTFVAVGKRSDLGQNIISGNKLAALTKVDDNGYGQILSNIRMLESLVYGTDKGEAPPKVNLRFGALFSSKTTVPCIVENVDIRTGDSGVFHIDTYVPKIMTVDLDLTVQYDLDEVPHYDQILNDNEPINPGSTYSTIMVETIVPKSVDRQSVSPKQLKPEKVIRSENKIKGLQPQISNKSSKYDHFGNARDLYYSMFSSEHPTILFLGTNERLASADFNDNYMRSKNKNTNNTIEGSNPYEMRGLGVESFLNSGGSAQVYGVA